MPECNGRGKAKPDGATPLKAWRYRFSIWSDRRVSPQWARGGAWRQELLKREDIEQHMFLLREGWLFFYIIPQLSIDIQ